MPEEALQIMYINRKSLCNDADVILLFPYQMEYLEASKYCKILNGFMPLPPINATIGEILTQQNFEFGSYCQGFWLPVFKFSAVDLIWINENTNESVRFAAENLNKNDKPEQCLAQDIGHNKLQRNCFTKNCFLCKIPRVRTKFILKGPNMDKKMLDSNYFLSNTQNLESELLFIGENGKSNIFSALMENWILGNSTMMDAGTEFGYLSGLNDLPTGKRIWTMANSTTELHGNTADINKIYLTLSNVSCFILIFFIKAMSVCLLS